MALTETTSIGGHQIIAITDGDSQLDADTARETRKRILDMVATDG